MKKILLCTLLTAACGPLLPTRAGEPEAPPPPPRERLERAEEKERPQPSELRRAEPRREREARPLANRERFRELRRERAELTAKLERSRAEGRREEARELQKRLEQLDREAAELGRRPPRPGPAGPPPPAPRPPGRTRGSGTCRRPLRTSTRPDCTNWPSGWNAPGKTSCAGRARHFRSWPNARARNSAGCAPSSRKCGDTSAAWRSAWNAPPSRGAEPGPTRVGASEESSPREGPCSFLPGELRAGGGRVGSPGV